MGALSEEEYNPPQWSAQENVDFRAMVQGPASKLTRNIGDKRNNSRVEVGLSKSRKRGRDEDEEEMDEEDAEGMTLRPSAKLSKSSDPALLGHGKGSGRVWKKPGQKASTMGQSARKNSWEKKMKEKELHKRMQELTKNSKDAKKQERKAEKERREAVKAKKEENRKKSELVQEVSTAKVKRMSKKQRAKVRMADTTKVSK